METAAQKRSFGYIVDQETRVDLLRNEAIARVVVDLIMSRDESSVTIGVHGDWGAGKSSVLHMIEASFDGKPPTVGEGCLCIRFNGWEYQGFEDAKIALIESVVGQLADARGTTAKVKGTLQRVRDSIDWLKVAKRGGGLLLDVATGLPFATVAMAAEAALSDPASLATRENAEAVAGEVGAVLKEKPESPSVPKELREFRAAFRDLLDDAGIRRLVVLVDDLDRCLPETAIQTLEAIRLFVSLPRTAFVVGADERMIEYAVRRHFKDLPDDETYRGYPRAYLEKLIQVPFRIPSLGEAETRIYVTLMLVGSLVGEDTEPFAKLLDRARHRMSTPWKRLALEDADLADAFCGNVPADVARAAAMASQIGPVLAQGTKGNPRLIKRFINALNLRLAVSAARGFEAAIDPAVLAKLMLAELFFTNTVFAHMGASVAASPDGDCPEVTVLEKFVRRDGAPPAAEAKEGTEEKASPDQPASGDLVSAWRTDPALLRWASVDPEIGAQDLRPYLFVVNDRHSFAEGARPMSDEVRAVLGKLAAGGLAARGVTGVVKALDGAEAEQLFSTLKARLLTERALGAAPPVVEGLLTLAEAHPGYQLRLMEAVEQLEPSDLGAWAGTKFDAAIKMQVARVRLDALKGRWRKEGGRALKKSLEMRPADKAV